MEYLVNVILLVEGGKFPPKNKRMVQIMTKKAQKAQVGWQFKGLDIISEEYQREHFFPAYVANRGYVTRSVKGWEDDGNENMYTVECTVLKYRNEDELSKQFEVLQVTRMKGKIIGTKILKSEKLFEEVEDEETD